MKKKITFSTVVTKATDISMPPSHAHVTTRIANAMAGNFGCRLEHASFSTSAVALLNLSDEDIAACEQIAKVAFLAGVREISRQNRFDDAQNKRYAEQAQREADRLEAERQHRAGQIRQVDMKALVHEHAALKQQVADLTAAAIAKAEA